jgi:purine-nucleoside phosphorylase
VAIVLGSGLGGFTERLSNPARLPYREIPGFAQPGVTGHAGELVVGELERTTVLCQSGRFHGYEGHSPAATVLPIRVFGRLGVGTLIVTNAAGGIRRSFRPGTLMVIADQLNLTLRSALAGQVVTGETRFPDMSAPYDPALIRVALKVANSLRVTLVPGVYAGLLGPSYETPAEIRMLERLGADAVGMSTVLEVCAARALGMSCLGFSVITNLASGLGSAPLSHAEVLAEAGRASRAGGDVIAGVIARAGR